eukprot:2045696-Rhodomonas_salina.1
MFHVSFRRRVANRSVLLHVERMKRFGHGMCCQSCARHPAADTAMGVDAETATRQKRKTTQTEEEQGRYVDQ